MKAFKEAQAVPFIPGRTVRPTAWLLSAVGHALLLCVVLALVTATNQAVPPRQQALEMLFLEPAAPAAPPPQDAEDIPPAPPEPEAVSEPPRPQETEPAPDPPVADTQSEPLPDIRPPQAEPVWEKPSRPQTISPALPRPLAVKPKPKPDRPHRAATATNVPLPSAAGSPGTAPPPAASQKEAHLEEARASPIDAGWMRDIGSWLAAHKSYPEEARQRSEEGRIAIRFTVDRAGRASAVDIVRSSGSAALDRAALGMLRDAVLPPVPATMTQNSITITVQIRYSLAP